MHKEKNLKINKIFLVKKPLLKILLTLLYIVIVIIFYITKIGCYWKTILHIPCIGCGLTTAFFHFFKLEFLMAFKSNFMFWSVPILYSYVWFDGQIVKNKKVNSLILALILFGFLVNWIFKLINL